MRKLTALVVFVVCLVSGEPAHAQTTDRAHVETLEENFAGKWVGTSRDYTKSRIEETKTTVEVTVSKHPGRLDWVYSYLQDGETKPDVYKRSLTLEPEQSAVMIERKDEGKKR